jgi:murein L,D-transpeptidase YcbB/YkuD
MRLLKSAACGLIFCSVIAGPATAVEPDAPEQLITRLDAIGFEVQKRLSASFKADSETEYEKTEHGALVEFYADHAHDPVWVTVDGLTDKARSVMKELARAEDYGLNSDDYDLPELDAPKDGKKRALTALAETEVTLSRSVLAYARDARGGRLPPQSLSKMLDPTLNLPDPLEVMEEFAKRDDPAGYLRDFHPKHPQFEALRKVLLEVRGSKEEKRIVIPNGPVIKPGETHAQIALVRQRLSVSVPERSGEPLFPAKVYDSKLEAAVRAFQKSHGLTADGIIGPSTRRAMNARPKARVKTILANLERWRWIPESADTELNVQVNIPEFRVRVFEHGKAILTERIVVGKTTNQTPVFSDQMERIVFHPYWNVPNSIKVEEILPHLRRRTSRSSGGFAFFDNIVTTQGNPRWMAANNLRIKYRGKIIDSTQIDWNRVDIRKFHFYQPPGGPNVLGVVKFMFPNKHTVYLHDTPSKHLFARTVRAESHGCMRVRNPDMLAKVLLKRDAGWSAGRVDGAIRSQVHQPVQLKNPIPVHVTYFTAKVRPDGTVQYIGDIYGHDARMARALKF